MTLQEKELLARFLEQLGTAKAGQMDAEAAGLIRDACARQPDAAYLLVQRTLQLEQLLQASQAQVQKLQADQERAGSRSPGSFLNDPNAWGSRASGPATTQPPAPGTAAPLPAGRGSWGSGLFGNIAATAAGVVAGSFLFQGIQGLMNRDDATPGSTSHLPEQAQEQAQASQPELLNSYDSSPDAGGDFFADSGDSGDLS